MKLRVKSGFDFANIRSSQMYTSQCLGTVLNNNLSWIGDTVPSFVSTTKQQE